MLPPKAPEEDLSHLFQLLVADGVLGLCSVTPPSASVFTWPFPLCPREGPVSFLLQGQQSLDLGPTINPD